ncbi:MAG: hypothetical protein ABL977_08715 [Candidatus Eisenbacteria bacterium]
MLLKPRSVSSAARSSRRSQRPAVVLSAIALLSLAWWSGSGCDKKHSFVPNQAPTLTLTNGPIDTVTTPQSWVINMAWIANDPDGSIDHFEYAIDPPTSHAARFALQETTWVSTTEHAVVVRFRASQRDTVGPGNTASEFHTFVLRAIDNRGAPSAVLSRSFYARTVAPDVVILRPLPSALLQAQVPSPFRLEWAGNDPDGDPDTRPAGYRFLLLDMVNPDNLRFLFDPDSLFKLGAGTGWEGWRLLSADTTSLALTDVVPNKTYLAVVLAVDAAGATTPYVNLNRNALQFSVVFPDVAGPRIHVFSPLIDFTYDTGGYSLDPLRHIPVEAPALQPLEFHWDGRALPGRVAVSSRWLIDGDPTDDAPGTGFDGHWSPLGPAAGTASLPGLSAGEHLLYIEMRDDLGGVSLAIVQITAVSIPLERELLVIDDTRLEADRFSAGGLQVYTRPWPSASELDTLLYARGGVPWNGARNPAGALSSPGLLAGYAFDTLGTRRGLEDPAQAVTLAGIGRYRHVLWLVDPAAAAFDGLPNGTALRAMSAPGRASTLAAYVEAGGRVWLAGGGGAFASLAAYNRRSNDTPAGILLTFDAGELGPGRPIYDDAHIRTALGVTPLSAAPFRSSAARGGWSGQGPDGSLSAPDYTRLPAVLRYRSAATDPIPATRLASQGSLFYIGNTQFEYVAAPNEVTEPVDPAFPDGERRSTLDTLYEVDRTPEPGTSAAVMTYYHGRDNVPFVFTGFAPWMWARADAQGLVDFVLGDIWGLPKSGPQAASVRTGSGAAGVRRSAPRVTAVRRLDPPGMRP